MSTSAMSGNISVTGNINFFYSSLNFAPQTFYTGTIVITPGDGSIYPGSGAFGGHGHDSTAKYAGLLLTGQGGGGGTASTVTSTGGYGGTGSYTLDPGVILSGTVQTATGGAGGLSTISWGGPGGGGPNGADGQSPALIPTSSAGLGGIAADFYGIKAAITAGGGNAAAWGYGGNGATRTTTPAFNGGLGGGGGAVSAVSGSQTTGGTGCVIVQYIASGITTTNFYNTPYVTTSLTLPSRCTNVKIWVQGGGGGGSPVAGSSYAGGAGGGGGLAYYEWPTIIFDWPQYR